MLFDPSSQSFLCLSLFSKLFPPLFHIDSFGFVLINALTPRTHQAQRKADSLHLSLSAIGDKVKEQTAPNKDIQKEIADMTEVRNGCFLFFFPHR